MTAQQSAVQIGLLTVDPHYQAQHLGKQLLAYAEQQARQLYHPERFEMSVVHSRHELIAYYERRGYYQSGVIKPYPLDQQVGTPKQPLYLLIMNKPA
ncbi:MAG: GNAT family N-acetyltransferase [Moraxellaceae bacterium]|nr:MAG: GNAT family N-acetyltransferase [Moraxellaceae bacterium]